MEGPVRGRLRNSFYPRWSVRVEGPVRGRLRNSFYPRLPRVTRLAWANQIDGLGQFAGHPELFRFD